jgi:hypothetical protein
MDDGSATSIAARAPQISPRVIGGLMRDNYRLP